MSCASTNENQRIIEKPFPKEEKIILDCEEIKLLSPAGNKKLDGREKSDPPSFTWHSNMNEGGKYIFKLFRMVNARKVLLFETLTDKRTLDWPESIEWKNKNINEEIKL